MDTDVYVRTRDQLHCVAESLIAGPQFRAAGTIRLTVRADGFGGVALPLVVQGTEFVWPHGRAPLRGRISDLATAAGVEAGPPAGVYPSAAPIMLDDELLIDVGAAARVHRSLWVGAQALAAFAPAQTPALWPEHFDIAVTVDQVNYGVSPGDSFHPLPYAYVGLFTARSGEFWNAPFGALLPLEAADEPDRVVEFFTEGQELAR